MSGGVLLLSLHTSAEFFFVGVERLSRLEQVKTRKSEIAFDVMGGGMGINGSLFIFYPL